jgi:hypothetical protein
MAIHNFIVQSQIVPRDDAPELFFCERRNAVGKPRDFTAGGVAVDDTFLRRADNGGLGLGHGGNRLRTIAGGNRLLDFSHCRTHARAPRVIDDGAARDLPSGFLGGLGIGHNG